MKNTQIPGQTTLGTLISRLSEGQYVVPDFQREFEWKPWDIKDLVRSVMLDYYIGSLLLWKGKEENYSALDCENIHGYNGDDTHRNYIVLDGQQRLTALHYAFTEPKVALPNRSNAYFYFVRVDHFMAERYDEAFDYDWLKRHWIELLADEQQQYSRHIFPTKLIGSKGFALGKWADGYVQYWSTVVQEIESKGFIDEDGNKDADLISEYDKACIHASNAEAFGANLETITTEYQIAHIQLDEDLSIDKVCDIFTQINSKGIQLDIFDLLNALLKPKGIQLKLMWREASKRLAFVDNPKMNVYILQVMSLVVQDYCSPKYLYYLLPNQARTIKGDDGKNTKVILMQDVEDFMARWDSAVGAMERSVKRLTHPHEYGVTSKSYIPYVSILPVFSAIHMFARELDTSIQLAAKNKIRFWYWASIFTSRYSGSVESTSTRDFIDLKKWLEIDGAEPDAIVEFRQRFRELNLRTEVKKGTSIYNGVFNLLVIQGARDWATGEIPQPEELEDHHIVPKSWSSENTTTTNINTILNRTPLAKDTNNKVIGRKLPNEYLPELISASGRDTVVSLMKSHFVSESALDVLLRNPFTKDDYEEFIDLRQSTIVLAIENLLIKQRMNLEPDIRELDERLEKVELSLRNLIDRIVTNCDQKAPEHIVQKATDRLLRAKRLDPTIANTETVILSKLLEFFDLRDLEATMINKNIWPHFSDIFDNKELMISRFGQIAELRNAIRHGRTVGEILKKDGEASLLWFEAIFERSTPLL